MSFELVAYEKLKGSIRESIITLIKSHNEKAKIIEDKLEDSVKEVSRERQPQVLVLLKTIELLDNSSKEPEDKARVLNALAYYIRDQIAATYKYTSPDNSDFYKSLTISLDLNKDNNPNREDLADMYGALEKFLRSHVYKNSDPRKGYLDKQPFAIKHYSVVDDILELSDRVHKLRREIIIAARDLHLLQQKPKGSQGGLFSVSSGKEKVTDTQETLTNRI
ncbi:TPA: Dot/Icm T4SS effector Lem14 [Legionella pneumophila]|uniref:Dot/Icm T4SS effector Lem14 n=1 Tax=Legionella pneumophila TaxID=446 RepID=UPI000787BF5F|nr:Dot/Icm T4SS effector Lem14 [Legionella pneumophila]MDW8877847.1 Dot/Icm T4SS effector Lem14 [Legionella pneumophila subsp. fraseri]MDW8960886.1 Dot/Icm T4SS effector Lem14 [Legionella pneumophila subsp. fraseri]MDW9035090.1 Dot/Icm T4SS effector Lem14 [Legionella pneumophila subsp. fraseri]MDW9038152.1 Dot/Icm T4SS effector Lem14 [Legionella pneumophila subsp. fraseri]MDW9041212.1 Dot/Icm T4SS effector Lem14 [Legionella pneumophila subsp. fraseri]